jgi:citrate lyase subunit beta/citryl-CoA lyase
MIETAQSVFRLEDIAATARDTRLSCLVVGSNDLAKELRMTPGTLRAPLTGFLGLTVAAARCHDIAVLDGVFNDFQDAEGFAQQCRQGAEFGFDGKTLIHPNQIEACNRTFSPTAESLAWARRVTSEFAKPENAARGALRLDGAMVERLHLAQAERLLAVDAALRAALVD